MIRPLFDRILVEPFDPFAEDEANGIISVVVEAPQSHRGTVVAIGATVKEIAVGDVVLYSQFAPTAAQEKNTDKTVIIPEDDVLAVIA